MNPSLFPINKQFGYSQTSLVLYVEDDFNTEINSFIKSNYNDILEYYSAKKIDFCYLPYLLQNKDYQAIVKYNRPYLDNDVDGISLGEIYRIINSRLTKPLAEAGLVWIYDIDYDNNSEIVFGYPLNEGASLIDQFNKLATAISELNDDENSKDLSNTPQFKRKLPEDPGSKDVNFMVVDTRVNEDLALYDSGFRFQMINEKDADIQFEFEAYRLADEIRTRIQLLKESGSLSLIGDILEEIQGATIKLSTVFITNDFRIFLKDYGMKEVLMPPLPKSLFILFLRHPEGIIFKQLSNYHDELLSIYRNITLRENIDLAMESIRAMTDPINNSINEKCSRIRAAFLEIIADDLAQNYYVTGKRGEPKKISLDRSMVEFQ